MNHVHHVHHVQIVSAPLPSGVTWLINCLLELNVRTTAHNTWWSEGAAGGHIQPADSLENLRWHLPVLQDRRRFDFRGDLEIFWGHHLAFAQYPARKTILYVRDPRDAAYSQFRRLAHKGSSANTAAALQRFLERPEIWWGDFEPLFDLPPADTLAYFSLLWRYQLAPEQLLTVRFEDVKANADAQLVRVLDFIGLDFSPSERQRALASSDLSHGLALTARMQARTGKPILSYRAGRVGEWQTQLTAPALACFFGPAAVAIGAFAYGQQASREWVSQVLLTQAGPLLAEFHQQLEQCDSGAAEALLRQAIAATNDPELTNLLAGQWLALLWTRAVMRAEQSHLPAAARMARFFSALNTHYADWPPLRRAAAAILNPDHLLHWLWPPPEIFHQAATSFTVAMSAALASRQPFFLWQQPGIEIENTGLLQLRGLLCSPHPAVVAAVVPVFDTGPQADFQSLARATHSQAGAEFRRIKLSALPACILFRTAALASLPTGSDPGSWLSGLWVHQAVGVLARSRFEPPDRWE